MKENRGNDGVTRFVFTISLMKENHGNDGVTGFGYDDGIKENDTSHLIMRSYADGAYSIML